MLTQLLLKLTYLGAEWILWLLAALSVLSIALVLERWFYYWRTGVDAEELGDELQERFRKGDLAGAWQLVKEQHTSTIECGVVAAGLINLRNGVQSASEAMLSAKSRMRPALDANLSILATIGSNAPFVGLLGTVLGIIKAAHEMNAAAGQQDPSAVMSGVFEALVATAVGLFVAIPAVVAYNLFERKVRTRLAAVDSLAHLVLANAAIEPQPADPSAPAAPTRAH
ncbi:MAG: MotA/TolQ/ExbB proton channel family protein [Pirellulales bacterium]